MCFDLCVHSSNAYISFFPLCESYSLCGLLFISADSHLGGAENTLKGCGTFIEAYQRAYLSMKAGLHRVTNNDLCFCKSYSLLPLCNIALVSQCQTTSDGSVTAASQGFILPVTSFQLLCVLFSIESIISFIGLKQLFLFAL